MNSPLALISSGFVLLYNSLISIAQSPNGTIGNWFMFFNQTAIKKEWSLHSEIQYRSFEVTPNTEQIMLRVGVNYHLNKNYTTTLGYAYIPNYAFDKEKYQNVQIEENRIWQQFLMKNKLNRINFEHRYRLEQRWLQSKNTEKYLNRIRYLIRATIPINKNSIEKNTFFVHFYNELFVHFSKTPFDRNRLYGAMGYQISPLINVQLGHLVQTVNTNKHYFQATINYNVDFRKTDSELSK